MPNPVAWIETTAKTNHKPRRIQTHPVASARFPPDPKKVSFPARKCHQDPTKIGSSPLHPLAPLAPASTPANNGDGGRMLHRPAWVREYAQGQNKQYATEMDVSIITMANYLAINR